MTEILLIDIHYFWDKTLHGCTYNHIKCVYVYILYVNVIYRMLEGEVAVAKNK